MNLKEKYNIEHFLNNTNFCEWVKGNKPELNSYYEDLIQNNPNYSKAFYDAAFIVKTLDKEKIITPYPRKAKLWKNIKLRADKKKTLHITVKKLVHYAALLLLLTTIGGGIYMYLFATQNEYEKFMSGFPQEMPAETKLFLSPGKEIEIALKNSEVTYKKDGSEVLVNGKTKYKRTPTKTSEELIYNQITVPFGNKSNILLSDGTKVWLNAGSRLVYPTKFGKKNRTVFLKGEGFFDVAKNKDKPFWVHTSLMKVRVVGTSFMIKAYPGEKKEEAIVATGVVSLKYRNMLLTPDLEVYPNQRAVTSGENTSFNVSEVKIKDYTSWIDDMFIFNNEPLSLVLEKVSRYYDIPMEWDKQIDEKKISGKLDLKKNYEQVLKTLSLISSCTYVEENKKIHFKLKKTILPMKKTN